MKLLDFFVERLREEVFFRVVELCIIVSEDWLMAIISGADMNALAQIGVLEPMPEGKKGGRRLTKQGQQDIDRIAKEIFESKQ